MSWFWLGGTTHGVAAENSIELLAQLRIITARPATDRDLTDAKGYVHLTNAQRQLVYRLAAHIPELMKGAPVKMTTSDNGLTYQTASDPLGHIEVYPGPRTWTLLLEGPLWDVNADYTREGARSIRMTNNAPRLFPDGPYARYIPRPGVIDDVSNPVVGPPDAQNVLPWMAAVLWAESGGLHDPSPYKRMVEQFLWGDPDSAGDVGLIPAYKLQHFSSGLSGAAGGAPWWRSADLGSVG